MDIMKKLKRLLLIAVGVIVVACGEDFLDPAPISAIGENEFYSNETELEAAVINIYDGLQEAVQREFALTEMRSDNTKSRNREGDWAQFETYSVRPTNAVVGEYWTDFYNVIFRANSVLEHLDVASEQVAMKFEGEAKFTRALCYFNLVRLYGNIPLVKKVVGPQDTDMLLQKPASEVYDLIISDLTTAVANLDNTYKGRASKAAAEALLAKVYLTLGNPALAKELLESVMNSGFNLEPNFHDVFYNELNDEIIFAIEYANDLDSDSQDFSYEFTIEGGTGLNFATIDILDALSSKGGAIRETESVLKDPASIRYMVAKFITSSSNARLCGNDWIVLRYADVLLMYVETVIALGNGESTVDIAAVNAYKLVKARAGFDVSGIASVTKQELSDERRVELAFENHRFYDLVRYGMAEEVLGSWAEFNGFVFNPTDLVLPIPQREINVTKGALVQNPGY